MSNVENGHVTPSKAFVNAYGSLGADTRPLQNLLADAQVAGADRRQRRRDETSPSVEGQTRLEAIRSRYDFDDCEYLVTYDGAGVVQEVTVVLKARPAELPVTHVQFAGSYNADMRPGVVSVGELTGCIIEESGVGATGAVWAVARLDEPMLTMDDRSTYSYRMTVNSEVRAQPLLREYSHKARARQVFRVQFQAPSLPDRIWTFRTRDHVEPLAEMPTEGDVLRSNRGGFYVCEFLGIRGEVIGVTWNWPER